MAKFTLDDMAATADLFGELKNGSTPKGFNELFNIPSQQSADNIKAAESEIDINDLVPYPEHYFKLPEGDEWDSFVASVRENGVLIPILVRHMENGQYQILAGHCRTQAAREAGISKIPARIIEADDVAASVIVGVTNKQREHISPLEWGRTYRCTYEQLKRQAGRPKDSSNSDEERTDEILSELYGDSRATIQRKMRLTYLIEPLAELFEQGRITQAIAVDVSYLTNAEQEILFNLLESGAAAITPEAAAALKYASGSMSEDDMLLMLSGGVKKKKPKPPIKKYAVPETYFPLTVTKKQRNDYIIAALKYIQENEIEIDVEK